MDMVQLARTRKHVIANDKSWTASSVDFVWRVLRCSWTREDQSMSKGADPDSYDNSGSLG